jgi:hypothetical protein
VAPVAYGALAMIAGIMVISVVAGALVGAVMCGFKRGLVWGILCVVAYLLIAPVAFDAATSAFTSLNGPPTVMTFFGSYVVGRVVRARNKSALWATLAALGGGLLLGALYLFICKLVFGVSFWGYAWVALIADLFLGILAVRMQPSTQRRHDKVV